MVKTTTVTTTTRQPRPKATRTVVTTRRGRRSRGARRAGALAKLSNCGKEYIKCILGEASSKIPDGDTHHTVCINYQAVQTVAPDTNGQLVVMALPGLPGSLRIVTGSGTFRDRVGGNITIDNVAPVGVTVPFPDFLDSGAVDDHNTRINFADVVAARVVSYELQVMQVGPVLYQQGSAVTARISMQPAESAGVVPQALAVYPADALYHGHTFANLTSVQPTKCLGTGPGTSALTFDTISTYPTSKICNATVPCKLLGKGCGDFKPVYQPNVYWRNTTNDAGDTVLYVNGNYFTGSGTGGWGGEVASAAGIQGFPVFPVPPRATDYTLVGDFWTDPDCEALIWAGTNFVPTASQPVTFQVRVKVCMELDIGYTGSIYRPLVTPPLPHDPVAVETADMIMKEMPPSVSMAEGSQSWLSSISSSVVGLADIVADMGIPVLSTAANIGSKIAKALGLG